MVNSERGGILWLTLVGLFCVSLLAIAVNEASSQIRYWSFVRAQRIQIERFAETLYVHAVNELPPERVVVPFGCITLGPSELLERYQEQLQQQPISAQFEALSARVLTLSNCVRITEGQRWAQYAIFIQINGPNDVAHIWLSQHEQRVW